MGYNENMLKMQGDLTGDLISQFTHPIKENEKVLLCTHLRFLSHSFSMQIPSYKTL